MFFVGAFSNILPLIALGIISIGLFFNGVENKSSYYSSALENFSIYDDSESHFTGTNSIENNNFTDQIIIENHKECINIRYVSRLFIEYKAINHKPLFTKYDGSRAPPPIV